MVEVERDRKWLGLTVLALVLVVAGWVPLIVGTPEPSLMTNASLVCGMLLGFFVFLRNRATRSEPGGDNAP